MTYPDRFKLIYQIINGEITAEEAVRLMGIPEHLPLVLEG